MKKLFVAAVCLLPLSVLAQDSFNLKGNVKSLKDGEKVFLVYVQNGERKVDSSLVSNGNFEFKGSVKAPITASLYLNKNPYVNRPAKGEILDAKSIYLEGVTFNADAVDSLKHLKITGSKVNADNAKLIEMQKPIDAKIAVLMKEYNAYTKEQKEDENFMKPFMEKYNGTNEERNPIIAQFISDNPNSYISLNAVRGMMSSKFNPAVVEPIFLKLSPVIKDSESGKKVANVIAGVKKTQIGMVADFTQNDEKGKTIKLSDFKGKYVLVDFWASWCGPCRQENPNVVAAFNKYKDKNFTIIGVSLDDAESKDAWLKAVADDGLNWTQLSDLKGWDNEVSAGYGIQSIPFNFLVDQTGKIVARNLRGDELDKKLAEFLDKKSK